MIDKINNILANMVPATQSEEPDNLFVIHESFSNDSVPESSRRFQFVNSPSNLPRFEAKILCHLCVMLYPLSVFYYVIFIQNCIYVYMFYFFRHET